MSVDIKEIFKKIYGNIHTNKEYLIKLDQEFGDGDLGLTMDEGFSAVCDYVQKNEIADKGILFKNISSILIMNYKPLFIEFIYVFVILLL